MTRGGGKAPTSPETAAMTTTTRGPSALPTRTTDTQLLKDLLLKDLLIMYPTVAHILLPRTHSYSRTC